jgi:hypothetical protein
MSQRNLTNIDQTPLNGADQFFGRDLRTNERSSENA